MYLNEDLKMIRTVKATIDEKGQVHLAEPLQIKGIHRALVTILEEPPIEVSEATLLSEPSLATDWSKPEEGEAWSHLQ